MLLKTTSFILILFVGMLLRVYGIITIEVRNSLSKIITYITLPAAVIIGYKDSSLNSRFLIIVIIGLALNVLTILVGLFISKGKETRERVTSCLSITGYNIGSFSLPLVQQFLPASYLAYICLFDFGNAIMTLGGSEAVITSILGNTESKKKQLFLLRIFRSPGLLIEFAMTVLALWNIHIPQVVYTLVEPAANANFFVSIILIGSMLQVESHNFKEITNYIIVRVVITIIASILIWLILPFDETIKLVVILACCSPISMLSAIYADRNGGDGAVASMTYSVYVLISVALMILVLNLI